MKHQTTAWENSLIWLGAGISIAEIQTGTYIAPLGFRQGIAAILLGHLIGCTMLFLAGLMGAQIRQSSMETVKTSFGQRGAILFAALNICQLVGWTAIMIYDGAISAEEIFHSGQWIWCIVIGLLIVVWLWIGVTQLGKLNIFAMTLLLLLTVWLCWQIFSHSGATSVKGSITFGAATELGVAMPLSWLPLISDYTSQAAKPISATLSSVITYGLISCWMDLIGMGASILTGQSNIAQVMVQTSMGVAGLLIIIFSTVTTTFMDAYSAGISTQTIWSKINGTRFAILVTIVGTIAAILFPMDNITNFLYLIGSVFAPMTAIMIVDYYFFHRSFAHRSVAWSNMVIWLIGFIIYRWLMTINLPLGNTLPDMVIVMIITWGWSQLRRTDSDSLNK